MSTPTRQLRSDAAANRERVLTAAAAAVKREGEKVPIATIAEEAGVGVGTLYRHYPTRAALLAALTHRSFRLVVDHARAAANSEEPAINSIGVFFEQTIRHRDELILPLHGGPVLLDQETVALQAEIRAKLTEVLRRGQRERNIRDDVTAIDIIITGAQLAQPLPHAPNWDRIARQQARIYLAGLAPTSAPPPAAPSL
ncbi:MAG: TetR/AcrR family transcriptional regulator [Actinomycetota bacterium]|nr:TetR/AcrR family transcriptional regulator [Actinomycetota bacterium]